ncbi:DUF1801 domain-containing protein [Neptunomonas japonica]|uniref:DUF1801 domain-containing protein n=1 Tax=Neptunomonas japonica TaxID=417574 RepID=UPI0004065F16|nr:DUF1801 domain-containing protein [Neptunomonas japonica]
MQPAVREKFNSYPKHIKIVLMKVRALVLDIIHDNNLGDVKETLKWGEPSYLVKGGSTVRLDWKPKYPEQYFVFFNCKTKLVDTFKELYSDTLEFQGNRAIVLHVNDPLPQSELRHCLELSLKYKTIKHLPLLGV